MWMVFLVRMEATMGFRFVVGRMLFGCGVVIAETSMGF